MYLLCILPCKAMTVNIFVKCDSDFRIPVSKTSGISNRDSLCIGTSAHGSYNDEETEEGLYVIYIWEEW